MLILIINYFTSPRSARKRMLSALIVAIAVAAPGLLLFNGALLVAWFVLVGICASLMAFVIGGESEVVDDLSKRARRKKARHRE